MTRVICMASAKGGSGKTSLTATFATFLSSLDYRVLMIDADPATNGLTLLFLKEMLVKGELVRSKGRAPMGLHEVLNIQQGPIDVVELSSSLHFLPATFGLQAIETSISEEVFLRMKALIQALRNSYDFIFIDSQAGADETARLAMSRSISDDVIIVSEYDPMSAAGVERLKGILRDDLTYDRTWVLLNKILPEFAQTFGDFMEVAKYLSPVPWDADVVRAYSRRRLALNSETGNPHTLAVLQTLRGFVDESTLPQLEKWVQTRAATIRQPIEQQYLDAEREMAQLLLQRSKLRRQNKFQDIAAMLSAALAVGGVLISTYALLPNSTFLKETLSYDNPLSSFVFLSIIVGFSALLLPVIKSIFGVRNIDEEVTKQRTDRQVALVSDRLKQLELLRSLDPESLIQRKIIPIETYKAPTF